MRFTASSSSRFSSARKAETDPDTADVVGAPGMGRGDHGFREGHGWDAAGGAVSVWARSGRGWLDSETPEEVSESVGSE